MEKLDKKSGTISAMFNKIAPKYDFLNHVLSFNMDKYWRKKLAGFLFRNKVSKVLDIACGTGDSTIGIYNKGIEVTGADIAEKMVEVALEKNKKLKRRFRVEYPPAGNGSSAGKAVQETEAAPERKTVKGHTDDTEENRKRREVPLPEYVIASAESLPFPDGAFDAVTISFGIRNFDKREHCLKEIYRVVKPGGCVAVLEFAKPRNRIVRGVYNLYFNNVLPIVGRMVSKDKDAYKYLAASVEQFPRFEAFCKEIESAGFRETGYRKYTAGIAVLYTGIKKHTD